MEDEQIYIICIIIVVSIIAWYCYNPKKDIFQYSLMVHLENDKVSEERIKKVKQIYDEYDLPMNLMKATHWKNDIDELKMYPIDKSSYEFVNRPGAYGLAGSLYKSLKKAHEEDWPHLLFLEDDSIPILPKSEFYDKFHQIITTLPDNGNGIYILGTTIYCQDMKSVKRGWVKKEDINIGIAGGHAILFSKQSISTIMNLLKHNKINRAIDNYIHNMKHTWFWIGDISKNGMFCGLYEQIDTNCNYRINTMPLQT